MFVIKKTKLKKYRVFAAPPAENSRIETPKLQSKQKAQKFHTCNTNKPSEKKPETKKKEEKSLALGQTKTNSARFPIPRRPLNRTNDISPFYFAPALPARLHRAMSNEQREMRTKGEIFETITEILHIQCVYIQKPTKK